jgi:flagellar motor switch protein FliG
MSNAPADAGGRKGTERAAILLLTLGEKEASDVLKHLSAKDVQRVGAAMAEVANVSRNEVAEVIASLASHVETQTSLGLGSDEYIRKTMINALGEDRAANVIDRILRGRASKGLETLKWMDPKAIAEILRPEHPQIAAIVLAYLDPEQSADVITLLPAANRPEIVLRIATLDGIQPSALQELDQIMERQFAGNLHTRTSSLGGLQAAADIVNLLKPEVEGAVMEEINKADEELGGKIQDLVFVFDNLIEIDDRSMQEILRQVPGDQLMLAMKAADEQLKAKIFKNMSQRAAEMLKDDLESRGPVRLSEVEAAQKDILATVRKLAVDGTVNLGGKGSDAYV